MPSVIRHNDIASRAVSGLPDLRRAGFSLLELLIYVAVLSVVVVFVAGLFITINQGSARAESAGEVNTNLRTAFDRIAADIRSAAAVSTPIGAGATSSVLQMNIATTTVSYCLVSGVVRRQSGGACGAASDPITASSVVVDALTFRRVENTNAVLGVTNVTVGIVATIHYNSDAPELQYTATKNSAIPIY